MSYLCLFLTKLKSETGENNMESQNQGVDIAEANGETSKKQCSGYMKTHALTIAIVFGILIGILFGLYLRGSNHQFTEREQMYVGYLGTLFLQMLKSLSIPLIVASLISAIASLDLSLFRKVAGRTIAYYLITTIVAIVLGLLLVLSIIPGRQYNERLSLDSGYRSKETTTVDTMLDLGRNMFPSNLIEASIYQYRTVLEEPKKVPYSNDNYSDYVDIYKYRISSEYVRGSNILGLVVAAVAVGIAISQLGDQAQTIANFFHNLLAVTMKISSWVELLSPIGISLLLVSKLLLISDIGMVMKHLGMYVVTVSVGLLIQGFVLLPLYYYVLTKKNPFIFIEKLGDAIGTAFGIASSMGTLGTTTRCLEENLGVDSRVVRFALPIGATISMAGTALYLVVTVMFIAQLRYVPIGILELLSIGLLSAVGSLAAAGIPQAGLITMVMLLDAVGLPADEVALVIAVDWLLDRLRTVINVMGHAFGAAIVDHWSQKELTDLQKPSAPPLEPGTTIIHTIPLPPNIVLKPQVIETEVPLVHLAPTELIIPISPSVASNSQESEKIASYPSLEEYKNLNDISVEETLQ